MRRIFITLFALIFLAMPLSAYAEALPDADEQQAVSSTDDNRPHVDFTPAEAIPAGVDIPYFYTRVESEMSLFIFMTDDGTIHKRVYGSVGGVSGWFKAEGVGNYVYSETPDVDLYEDLALYEASPWVYTGITTAHSNPGLLDPTPHVTSVDTLFGVSMSTIFKILGAITVAVCLVIVIAAGNSQRKAQSGGYNRRGK